MPIGGRDFQEINLIRKNQEGVVSYQKISDVRYVSLSSVEEQLNRPF